MAVLIRPYACGDYKYTRSSVEQIDNIFGCGLIGESKELGLAFFFIELTLKICDPCPSHRVVFTCSKVQASVSSSLTYFSLHRAGPLGKAQDIISPSCSVLFY